ncbi:MAG TPA: hypothetical protein DEA44_00905 [Firmicutes bacterium]|nr:hypothetical protein [Bacillota bacterium]
MKDNFFEGGEHDAFLAWIAVGWIDWQRCWLGPFRKEAKKANCLTGSFQNNGRRYAAIGRENQAPDDAPAKGLNRGPDERGKFIPALFAFREAEGKA